MYKMGEVSVINIHENDDVNKTNLKLLCISDVKKDWVVISLWLDW